MLIISSHVSKKIYIKILRVINSYECEISSLIYSNIIGFINESNKTIDKKVINVQLHFRWWRTIALLEYGWLLWTRKNNDKRWGKGRGERCRRFISILALLGNHIGADIDVDAEYRSASISMSMQI